MIPHQIPHQTMTTEQAERRVLEDMEPWKLSGETLIEWIVRQPDLWDIGSQEACAAAVPVREAVRGKAPQEPGVYFLMTDDGGFRYVGKATYIRDRIIDHVRRGKQFTHCWWIEMPRKAAEMVEAYLIRHHKFPLNKVRSYSADTEFVTMLADAIERSLKYHNDCRLATRMNPQPTAKKLEAERTTP
jgi:hypothetical protein